MAKIMNSLEISTMKIFNNYIQNTKKKVNKINNLLEYNL